LFIEVGFCDARLSAELSMQFESEPSFSLAVTHAGRLVPPTGPVSLINGAEIFSDEKTSNIH
jgi:hypothetical protein